MWLYSKWKKDQFDWEKSSDNIAFEIPVFKHCVIYRIKNYCYKNYETTWKPNLTLRTRNYRIVLWMNIKIEQSKIRMEFFRKIGHWLFLSNFL